MRITIERERREKVAGGFIDVDWDVLAQIQIDTPCWISIKQRFSKWLAGIFNHR